MIKLDKIIISSNDHPYFLPYWPYVARAWTKLLGIRPTLVYLAEDATDDRLRQLGRNGNVVHYKPVAGIPQHNQAKVARLHYATTCGDQVCLINDVDLMPLQSEYVHSLLEQRMDGHILCVGGNLYDNTCDKGKFPMGYVTAEGSTFKEILNPDGLNFEDFVRSLVGRSVCDKKEDIMLDLPVGHHLGFSDESLMRSFLVSWDQDRTIGVPIDWRPCWVRTVDRSAWDKFDQSLLPTGQYVDSHMPRPFDFDKIKPLVDFVNKKHNYCIDANYIHRTTIEYLDVTSGKDEAQNAVYAKAKEIVDREGYTSVADFGCGSGYKLLKYFSNIHTIGYDLPQTVSFLQNTYTDREWATSDLHNAPAISSDLVISADVIEHLLNPDELLEWLSSVNPKRIVLSTPDRNTVSSGKSGPPSNRYHTREWNFDEFDNYIKQWFRILEHYSVTEGGEDPYDCQIIVCEPY